LGYQSQITLGDQNQIIVITYKGKNQDEAMSRFKVDSTEMAADGYFPTSQSWAPGLGIWPAPGLVDTRLS